MNDQTEYTVSDEERERRTLEERRLNDLARTEMGAKGQVFATPGVMALDMVDRRTLRRAIEGYDAWDEGNDPYGIHDFGCVYGSGLDGLMVWELNAVDTDEKPFAGTKIFWKIDVYAPDVQQGAERPWVEAESIRVLTLMLASEY